MIKLGSLVSDKITGFKGIAMSSTEWLYGCVRVYVEPQELHEGVPSKGHTFDEQRLEVVAEPSTKLAAIPVENNQIALGSMVEDEITKFRGMVIARTLMLGGRASVGVESRELTKEGKPRDGQWFEERRVTVVAEPDAKVLTPEDVEKASANKPGGPRPDLAPRNRGTF